MMRWLLIFVLVAPLGAQVPCHHSGLGKVFHKHCVTQLPEGQTAAPQKRFPWGPITRGTMNFTATSMDIWGQQRCLNRAINPCVEKDPFAPTNPKVIWPLYMSVTGLTTLADFESWKQQRKWGWIGPLLGITQHTVGAVTGWTK
jgi:hypothetical protein